MLQQQEEELLPAESQISTLIPSHTTNFLILTPSTLVLESLPWLPCALQNKSCTLNLPFRTGTSVSETRRTQHLRRHRWAIEDF